MLTPPSPPPPKISHPFAPPLSSAWTRSLPVLSLPPPLSPLHLHTLHKVPVLLWRRLLHALLPAMLLDVALPLRFIARPHSVYPVHVVRSVSVTCDM
jgi:hypothetical protein